MKKALITGITGQDGSYLAELLLEKGYEVSGTVRPTGTPDLDRLTSVRDRICFIPTNLGDQSSIDETIRAVRPDEVYNLAAESFVPTSWEEPAISGNITGQGAARVLGALYRYQPNARFCQASSAQLFGKATEIPQTEKTPIRPVSPYGAAKAYAHFLTGAFRESSRLFACSAILFNHESPRRSLEFVTRKITHAVARIKFGLEKELRIGNTEAKRDWGFAGDYIRAMWLMLQQQTADDYVIATGEAYSVQDLINLAFEVAGIDPKKHVVVDPKLFRPAEADIIVGSPEKARRLLKWEPRVKFPELVQGMVKADLRLLEDRNAMVSPSVRSI